MRALALLAGLVALAAAGGCGDDRRGGGARLDAQVTYTRGGGIAGRSDRLVVQPDGSATLETRKGGERRLKLNSDELGEIAGELRRANLPSLPPTSAADPPVADALAHKVVYRGRTVTADDPSMPARLRGLVAALGRVIDAHDKG